MNQEARAILVAAAALSGKSIDEVNQLYKTPPPQGFMNQEAWATLVAAAALEGTPHAKAGMLIILPRAK